jgi:hypothetical protein
MVWTIENLGKIVHRYIHIFIYICMYMHLSVYNVL